MMKKFWLFKAGAHFELRETIAGSPTRAKLSRGVRDKATGPNAVRVLANSIIQVTKQISDGIAVSFRPHPQLVEQKPDFYKPLTPEQKKQAKDTLGPSFTL